MVRDPCNLYTKEPFPQSHAGEQYTVSSRRSLSLSLWARLPRLACLADENESAEGRVVAVVLTSPFVALGSQDSTEMLPDRTLVAVTVVQRFGVTTKCLVAAGGAGSQGYSQYR